MENKPQFPLPVMPRMGRRNAIAFPDIHTTISSEGAFAPLNLHNRKPTDLDDYNSLDPEGVLAKQLRQERLRRLTTGETSADSPTPLSSMNDTLNNGWTKLLEASNNYNKFVEGLGIFDNNKDNSKVQEKLDVLAIKQMRVKHVMEGDRFGATRISPIIPWRKPDGGKKATPAEERQKMFESFNNTSFEPPETPPGSDSTLKKSSKKWNKVSKGYSQESMASTRSKQAPDPYAYIQPRVDTGMRFQVIEESSQNLHIHGKSSILVTREKGAKRKDTKLSVKSTPPSSSSKKKASTKGSKGSAPPKPAKFIGHKVIKSQLAAEDTLIGFPKKLPLTIGPRYSHKKAWGINKEMTNRAELISDARTRLYQATVTPVMPHQKWKYEPKSVKTTTLQSTFLNLHKINSGLTNRKLNPDHLNAPLMKLESETGEKKPPVLLQTIQAPPSPFLMSTLSIPGQMNPIPMNGELLNSKVIKPDTKSKKVKSGSVTKDNKPLKVIPALGRSPNKYNNIFIGPYSGSESEMGDFGRLVRKP